jgi:ribosomal protein L35
MKTNKSYSKRVKVTKSGKVKVRRPGINHYNALERRVSQLGKRKPGTLQMNRKAKARFLANVA